MASVCLKSINCEGGRSSFDPVIVHFFARIGIVVKLKISFMVMSHLMFMRALLSNGLGLVNNHGFNIICRSVLDDVGRRRLLAVRRRHGKPLFRFRRPGVTRHGRTGEGLSCTHKVPGDGDAREAGEDDGGVVHAGRGDGDGDWHAKQDDGQSDPAEGGDVDEEAETVAEAEPRVSGGPAASHDVDQDGDPVARAQADGGDPGEGVEGGGGSEVDETEEAVDDGGQEQSPEGYVEPSVDPGPDSGTRDGPVAGEGVGATRGGRQGSRPREEENAQDQKQQTEPAGGGTGDGLEQQADGLTVGDVQEDRNVGEHEEDGDQVDDPGDAGGRDRQDHGLGDLPLGPLHLLAHGRHHAVTREGVCRLEESDEKRPPAGPTAGRRVKVGKHKGAASAVVGHGQQSHEDDDDRGRGPIDTDLVDQVEVASRKDVDQHARQHDGPEHQHGLVGVGHETLVPESDGREDELTPAEVDGQGHGPVADEGQPAVDVGHHGGPFLGAEHGGPVINSALNLPLVVFFSFFSAWVLRDTTSHVLSHTRMKQKNNRKGRKR